MLQSLRNTLSTQTFSLTAATPPVGAPANPNAGDGNGQPGPAPKNQAPWVTPEGLTFPALSVVAGLFMNFADVNGIGSRWLVGGIISLVFGGFLLFLSLTDKQADRSKHGIAVNVFVGLINIGIMFVTIVGVGSIGVETSG